MAHDRDPIDAATTAERQRYLFEIQLRVLRAPLAIRDKDEARSFFAQLRQKALDLNGAEWKSEAFHGLERDIDGMLAARSGAAV